jgi:hypothetical protein
VIDLVAVPINATAGLVEGVIFGKDIVDGHTMPPFGVSCIRSISMGRRTLDLDKS